MKEFKERATRVPFTLSSTTIMADGMRHAATAAEGVDGITLSWRPRAEVVSAASISTIENGSVRRDLGAEHAIVPPWRGDFAFCRAREQRCS